MTAQIIVYVAIFLNCWVMGRSVSFDSSKHDIYALLQTVIVSAAYNTIIFTGILLAALK